MEHRETVKQMVSFSACAGSAAGKARFKDFPTCEAAVKSGFLRGECMSGCVGVGDCVAVCVKGALSRDNGKVVLDRERCDGCGDCCEETVCPQHLIRLVPAQATTFIPCSSMQPDEELTRMTCTYGCIACGECERACPVGAIHIEVGHAVIDYEKCVGCMACVSVCRKKIIVDTFHDPEDVKSTVAFVRCSGNPSAKLNLRDISCKEAVRNAQTDGCSAGCVGCCDCVSVCRVQAIQVKDGVATVNRELCTGCKDCAHICPQDLIVFLPLKGIKQVPCAAQVEDKRGCDNACTACGICVENCPVGAAYIEQAHVVIDPELCENCALCSTLCPEEIITELFVLDHINVQHTAYAEQEGS